MTEGIEKKVPLSAKLSMWAGIVVLVSIPLLSVLAIVVPQVVKAFGRAGEVIGLVCLSIMLIVFYGSIPVAIISGIAALVKISHNKAQLKGMGRGIFGICAGVFVGFIMICLIIIGVTSYQRIKERQKGAPVTQHSCATVDSTAG